MSYAANGRASSSYLENEIGNEAPLALIARLYSMTGLELSRARAALAAGDVRGKALAVERAGRCLSLLQCSLNRDKGGEVAVNLDRIYTYLLARLSQAHVNNDPSIFEELSTHVRELGGAWRQVASNAGGAAAGAEAAPTGNGGPGAPAQDAQASGIRTGGAVDLERSTTVNPVPAAAR